MTEQTPNPTPETVDQEPFIPPGLLLILAGAGALVAALVFLTQNTFGVVGIGALALAVVCLVLWGLMAPDQLRSVLTGRTLRYGGLSIIVTIIVIAAMVAIFTFVRGQSIRVDLTQRSTFSLTPESESAISGIGADPTIPPIRILAFYGSAQAGRRDQDTVLFDSYVRASNGKISYEFYDADRVPTLAQQYGVTRNGQIVITTPQLDENGQPVVNEQGAIVYDTENAELVSAADQGLLTNAILKVAASGNFRAFFITGENTQSNQMVTLTRALTTQYDWTVRDISLVQLSNPQGEFRLNDPNVDGEVIVLPGGSRPLSDQELQILTDYLDAGGALVIFAGNSLNAENTSLATSENLNAYLEANFGLRINNDLVIDQTQNFLTPEFPVASTLDSTSYITTRGINRAQAVVVFEVPHSITISETLPPGVTATSLIRTTPNAYSKTNVTALLLGAQSEADVTAALAQSPDDPTGPLTLAAIAENANTGAKVIVFGSTSPALDTYTQFQTANLTVAFNSLIYATDFNTFFSQIVVQQQQRPQDTPIFATDQVLRNINLITIIGLPFGILALGIVVWWSGRERARR